jgi:hypothetical protein
MRGKIIVVMILVIILFGIIVGVNNGYWIQNIAHASEFPKYEGKEIIGSIKSTFPTKTNNEISFIPFLLFPVFLFFFITVEVLDYLSLKNEKVKSKKKSKSYCNESLPIFKKSSHIIDNKRELQFSFYDITYAFTFEKPDFSSNMEFGFEIIINNKDATMISS